VIAALRTGTVHAVLRQLSLLGASIECRGDKMVLRVGVRPVPPELIAAARARKAELAKMLTVTEGAHRQKNEHLRPAAAANPRISTAFSEGAQSCENERLREPLNALRQSGDFQGSPPPKGSPAPAATPKALTEDAQVSTFDKPQGFCGFRPGPASKVLTSSSLSIFGRDEHLREPTPADWPEAKEERAAIVEYDGGIPRVWAEGLARLNPDHPPVDVPPKRWLQFIDDIAIFLDRWAACAATLGWGANDLFGCDGDRPFARIDQAGLLWILDGDKLRALSEHTATIETRSGARQTWRRRPGGPGRVLPWELESRVGSRILGLRCATDHSL
jgi:hypothetical protein